MEHSVSNDAAEIVNRLLAEIGREHGLILALNEHNTCAIDMASDVSLILEATEDRCLARRRHRPSRGTPLGPAHRR